MTRLEREGRSMTENLFRAARVIAVGLAIIGGSIAGVNAAKGNYENTEKYGSQAVLYSLVAGGIFAAEKAIRQDSKPKPPENS